MISRANLLKSKEYWRVKIQNKLFNLVQDYLDDNNKTKTQFAKELGVSKGYVSQILNGDYDHKLSKLVKLSLAIGKVPVITFKDIEEVIKEDEQIKTGELKAFNETNTSARPSITLNFNITHVHVVTESKDWKASTSTPLSIGEAESVADLNNFKSRSLVFKETNEMVFN